MGTSTLEDRRQLSRLSRESLQQFQLVRLNEMLDKVLPANTFYTEKLQTRSLSLDRLDQLSDLPFTYKQELVDHGPEDLAANLTFPLRDYVRFHRTSGTQGRPLVVVDTAHDWQWWIDTWQFVLDAADVTADDRVFMSFSFGPFIGFWSAHDAVVARPAMAIPAGGLSSLARLELLRSSHATVMCCTPTYALRLAEVAHDHQFNVAELDVSRIIVAGEPGGSLPNIRDRIESIWQARLIDHSGATEVGPWGFSDLHRRGLHVIETSFIAEFYSLESGQPAADGELSELVITSLGRTGCPVIRYRTGDLVRPTWRNATDCSFVLLEGGVLGRTDDMLVIRGVNIFPSSVEQILRGFPEIIEYRITAKKHGEMDALAIEIEDRLNQPERVRQELNLRLGLQIEVSCAPLGSLPRFEGKGRRFIDQRRG